MTSTVQSKVGFNVKHSNKFKSSRSITSGTLAVGTGPVFVLVLSPETVDGRRQPDPSRDKESLGLINKKG